MGCNASKEQLNSVVVPAKGGQQMQQQKGGKPKQQSSSDSDVRAPNKDSVAVLPRKGIAFEVSLDDNSKTTPRSSLPALSHRNANEKLKNADAIWQEMDEKDRKRKAGKRGAVADSKDDQDVEALRQKIAEKEAQAAANRQRELEKVQTRLKEQEMRLRNAQMRKKAMEENGEYVSESQENVQMTWGGEGADENNQEQEQDQEQQQYYEEQGNQENESVAASRDTLEEQPPASQKGGRRK